SVSHRRCIGELAFHTSRRSAAIFTCLSQSSEVAEARQASSRRLESPQDLSRQALSRGRDLEHAVNSHTEFPGNSANARVQIAGPQPALPDTDDGGCMRRKHRRERQKRMQEKVLAEHVRQLASGTACR